jgi:hypothetical protein
VIRSSRPNQISLALPSSPGAGGYQAMLFGEEIKEKWQSGGLRLRERSIRKYKYKKSISSLGVNFLHFALEGKIITFERERGRVNIGPSPKKGHILSHALFYEVLSIFPQIFP